MGTAIACQSSASLQGNQDTALRFLAIEDDEGDFRLLARLLRTIYGQGVRIQWADCAQAASTLLCTKQFDLVFVDENLGAVSGIQCVQTVREAAGSSIEGCAFILVTGRDCGDVDVAATHAGFCDYLLKSELAPGQLERAVRYALETQRRKQEILDQKRALDAALCKAQENEQRFRRLAQLDPLTGIANRSLFMERLASGFAAAKARGQGFAVAALDLDRFKNVNDTLGHQVGDELLKAVAHRLTDAIRGYDTAARLGGDEFALILPSRPGSSLNAVQVGERIADRLSASYEIMGHEVTSAASVGIAIMDDTVCDGEALLARADMALYHAKRSPSRSFYIFDAALDEEVRESQSMEQALIRSIDRGELYPVFQPKVHAGTGDITGLEVLARWEHPDLGDVPPDIFIPLAEKCGRILPLSAMIFSQACATAACLRDHGFGIIPVAFNLSRNQLLQGNLLGLTEELLARHGLSPEFLEYEITETIMPRDLDLFASEATRLRDMGVTLTLDDFGTGLGSLENLRRLPISKLKIDRRFVLNMIDHRLDHAIVTATISMARSIGLTIIAEGVETEEHHRTVFELGCDEIQGFYISRPLRGSALRPWLTDNFADGATH